MNRLSRGCLRAVAVMMVLVATFVGAGAVSAHDNAHPPRTLASGLVGPLGLAVTERGDVLVTQAFVGKVSRVDRHGVVTDLATEADAFLTPGVADAGKGRVLYTTSGPAGAFLKSIERDGSTRVIADIGAYEASNNPDQSQHYGFVSIDADCASQWPAAFGPPQYTGIVDSDPYAIATSGSKTYVADAAGNTIVSVDRRGHVRTVAVLPPQPTVVTQDAIDALGLPPCTLGLTYNFEAVPTDVEVYHGQLYVTTLPGGPEDASLGARGGVWRINPTSGRATQIGFNLLGATDLAVAPSGAIYVTELFGGQVTKVGRGATSRSPSSRRRWRSSGPTASSTSPQVTRSPARPTRWRQARSSRSGRDEGRFLNDWPSRGNHPAAASHGDRRSSTSA